VADGFDKPNGITFSPDERVLYVTDSGANREPGSQYVDRAHHIKAFAVVGGRRLARERLFPVIAPGFPDGLKVDCHGRVYASSFPGVQVLDPARRVAGRDSRPRRRELLLRGGTERNLLFITTDAAGWAAALAVKGA
jgi:gluconolactonase